MRGFCGVRPDASRLADAVKMMLEALEQHLADLNIKEVRDGVVKLRQFGRIMMGVVALCCETRVSPPCLRSSTTCASRTARLQAENFPNLGRCTLCWRCRQASPMRISVMLADSNPQSMMGTWSGTCSDALLLQSSFSCFSRRICTDSSSPRFSVTRGNSFHWVSFTRFFNTGRIGTTGSSGTY